MIKKRITAILAAAIIAVGASVPAFADEDFNTAENDAQVLLTAQEAQADTALDIISDDSAAVALSDNYDTAAINETDETEDDDSDKAPVATRDIIIAVCISVVVGIIIGFIGSGIMKSKLTSVRYQSGAADYIVPDSFKLNDSRDVYLYSTVTKTERQTDKDRSCNKATDIKKHNMPCSRRRKPSVRLYGIFLSEMPNNCLNGWFNFALQALDKRRG